MIQVPNGITTSYFSEGQCVPSTWRFGTGSFHAKRLIFDWSKLIAFLFDHSFRGISDECNYGIRLSSIGLFMEWPLFNNEVPWAMVWLVEWLARPAIPSVESFTFIFLRRSTISLPSFRLPHPLRSLHPCSCFDSSFRSNENQ